MSSYVQGFAEAARAASAYSGDDARLEKLARSAESAVAKAGESIAEARDGFGEVSKHLIALIGAEPDVASERYVFECPMARSYPKWGSSPRLCRIRTWDRRWQPVALRVSGVPSLW